MRKKSTLNTPQQDQGASLDRNHLRKVARSIPFLVWAAIIIWLSLRSGDAMQSWWHGKIPHGDKVMHAGAYGLLGLLGMYASGGRKLIMVIVICALLGGVLEVLQLEMRAGRNFEVLDIIANIIGSLLGGVAFTLFFKRKDYGS